MKTTDVEKIKPGDEIWRVRKVDADTKRYRPYKVKSISLKGDMVTIVDIKDRVLECHAGEIEMRI